MGEGERKGAGGRENKARKLLEKGGHLFYAHAHSPAPQLTQQIVNPILGVGTGKKTGPPQGGLGPHVTK